MLTQYVHEYLWTYVWIFSVRNDVYISITSHSSNQEKRVSWVFNATLVRTVEGERDREREKGVRFSKCVIENYCGKYIGCSAVRLAHMDAAHNRYFPNICTQICIEIFIVHPIFISLHSFGFALGGFRLLPTGYKPCTRMYS